MGKNTTRLHEQANNQPASPPATPPCRVIAWEVTRRCNLACLHCRASAQNIPYNQELSLAEASQLIQSFPKTGSPLVIFTGGEPLLRSDIFELVSLVKAQGLRAAISVNGTLLNAYNVAKMKESGISRCSISLDGENAITHDRFRGVPGAFEQALRGIALLRKEALSFQINTTITPHNLHSLAGMLNLCKQLGAVAWHIFLLVPVGRGKNLQGLNPESYEKALNWIYNQAQVEDIEIKPTCAPQYNRLASLKIPNHTLTNSINGHTENQTNESAKTGNTDAPHASPSFVNIHASSSMPSSTPSYLYNPTSSPMPNPAPKLAHIPTLEHGHRLKSRGCLGGLSFCFISHLGQVQPCGYLELNCGNVREKPFPLIWQNSQIFQNLRNPQTYTGQCGTCRYHNICGGCRARALAHSGNYLHDDPVCLFNT